MAIFIISDSNMLGKDSGYIQTKLITKLVSISVTLTQGASYQADMDTDTVYVDPALNMTKAQVKALGLQKAGNGVSHEPYNGYYRFVVPESDYSTTLNNIAGIKALT